MLFMGMMPPASYSTSPATGTQLADSFGGVPLRNDSRRVSRPDSLVSSPRDHSSPHIENSGTHVPKKVKCVLVGDGSTGKTTLIVSYTTNGYPTEYVPTTFDDYSVKVTVDNKPVRFQLCDTAGQSDFDSLRPLCYPNTDVFLLCFSVVNPTSFVNLSDKWLPELQAHSPDSPVLLVGTQCDLRSDVGVLIELERYRERPVTVKEARAKAASLGAVGYIECSSLTCQNLKEVFDTALLTALEYQTRRRNCPPGPGADTPNALLQRNPSKNSSGSGPHTPSTSKKHILGGFRSGAQSSGAASTRNGHCVSSTRGSKSNAKSKNKPSDKRDRRKDASREGGGRGRAPQSPVGSPTIQRSQGPGRIGAGVATGVGASASRSPSPRTKGLHGREPASKSVWKALCCIF